MNLKKYVDEFVDIFGSFIVGLTLLAIVIYLLSNNIIIMKVF